MMFFEEATSFLKMQFSALELALCITADPDARCPSHAWHPLPEAMVECISWVFLIYSVQGT